MNLQFYTVLDNFESFEDLESAINTYINFYNSKRVTLSMGLRIPL
ncbi:IS3 family transposase [Aerococcus viridans]